MPLNIETNTDTESKEGLSVEAEVQTRVMACHNNAAFRNIQIGSLVQLLEHGFRNDFFQA